MLLGANGKMLDSMLMRPWYSEPSMRKRHPKRSVTTHKMVWWQQWIPLILIYEDQWGLNEWQGHLQAEFILDINCIVRLLWITPGWTLEGNSSSADAITSKKLALLGWNWRLLPGMCCSCSLGGVIGGVPRCSSNRAGHKWHWYLRKFWEKKELTKAKLSLSCVISQLHHQLVHVGQFA